MKAFPFSPKIGSPGCLQRAALFELNPRGRLESQRNDRQSNTTLGASLQCGSGSQTPKDTPPVPGYKHTKWLPRCFQAVQLSARGEKYS